MSYRSFRKTKIGLQSLVITGWFLLPTYAFADIEGSLNSLVNGVLGRIFPIFGLYFAGDAALAFAQDKPEAKQKIKSTALGIIALLGINGVWTWLKGHVK